MEQDRSVSSSSFFFPFFFKLNSLWSLKARAESHSNWCLSSCKNTPTFSYKSPSIHERTACEATQHHEMQHILKNSSCFVSVPAKCLSADCLKTMFQSVACLGLRRKRLPQEIILFQCFNVVSIITMQCSNKSLYFSTSS